MAKKNWENTTERYICFLDIMGFKEMVMRNDHPQLLKKMEDFVDSLTKWNKMINEQIEEEEWVKIFKDRKIEMVTFSDSILLLTRGSNIRDLTLLILMTKLVLFEAFKQRIPVKGAIAKGMFTADFDKNIFIGQPLVDAYLLQDELLYYGIVCTGLVEKDINENQESEQYGKLVFSVPTFLKTGKLMYTNVSLWHSDLKESDLKELYYTVDGKPRVYVDNTIEMFRQCQDLKV